MYSYKITSFGAEIQIIEGKWYLKILKNHSVSAQKLIFTFLNISEI